jgi:uncharacterized membrane protein
MKKKKKLVRLVLLALFAALIVVLTFTPLGYIIIGPGIAITTIHLVTILGASIFGPKEGAFLGAFWGVLCVIKAFQEPIPANIPFQNPMISVVPRIFVGLVTGIVVMLLLKTKIKKPLAIAIGALAGTLTNTVLVITALNVFNGFETLTLGVTTTLNTIITTLIGVNGIIEVVAAVILVPTIYMATNKYIKDKI